MPEQAAAAGSGAEGSLAARAPAPRRRRPELIRREPAGAVAAAVLVEVVGQLVRRAARCGRRAPGRLAGGGTVSDAGDRPGGALARRAGKGQRLLQPVIAGRVPLGVAHVGGGGGLEEDVWQGHAVAQPPGVHCRLNHRPGRRLGVPVAVQQDGRPGQELGHLPAVGGTCGGQPRVTGPAQGRHLGRGERAGYRDAAALQ